MANDDFKFPPLGALNPNMVMGDPTAPNSLSGQDPWQHLANTVATVHENSLKGPTPCIMDAKVLHVEPNSEISPGDYRPHETEISNAGDTPNIYTKVYVSVPEAGDVFNLEPNLNRARDFGTQGWSRTDTQALEMYTRVYSDSSVVPNVGDIITINRCSQTIITAHGNTLPAGPIPPPPNTPQPARASFDRSPPVDLSSFELDYDPDFMAKFYDAVYPGSSFVWADFVAHASSPHLDNTPSTLAQDNIIRFAKELDKLKEVAGDFSINSAFRSEEVNAYVGGSSTSHHKSGLAADITFTLAIPDADRVRYFRELIPSVIPDFDQLIIYENTNHIHISLKGTRKSYLVKLLSKNSAGKSYESWAGHDGRLKNVAIANGVA